MSKKSAGLLMYRIKKTGTEVLLVHPGGPFWKNKDSGAWSIPKGEYQEGQDPLEIARREFMEETGFGIEGEFIELGEVKQKGGKIVRIWAVEGDLDASLSKSNTFALEWPPKSGIIMEFPEVDHAKWFSPEVARKKILSSQAVFLDRLSAILHENCLNSSSRSNPHR